MLSERTDRLKNNAVGNGAMLSSTSNVFCRVNRRRRCWICGKPDWCSYVRDESLSICMRVSDGARKINHQGGAIFIHNDWREDRPIDVRVVTAIPQAPIAPVEIRDFVYGKLIDLSPATLYPSALIAGEKGLLARGLNECFFGNYGGLPAGSRERDRIARLLLQEIKDRFPSAGSLLGIPGFWEDREGVHLWKPKDYLAFRATGRRNKRSDRGDQGTVEDGKTHIPGTVLLLRRHRCATAPDTKALSADPCRRKEPSRRARRNHARQACIDGVRPGFLFEQDGLLSFGRAHRQASGERKNARNDSHRLVGCQGQRY